ncbi:MAG: AraC family transcriptional regulator [Bryobacteraceae bacterium]
MARKVGLFIGSAEVLATEIPGLTLYRRTAATAPASVTYEPSVAVVVRGRKRVELGRTTFFYDESQFLLTSLDLPVISQVVEASETSPYLCMRLKLEMPTVRKLLSRGEIQVTAASSDNPAMTTGRDHSGVPQCILPAHGSAEHPAGHSVP